ncbi:MAG: acyl-CoA dehydrogenase, partial [Bacteroidales bacterium]|nr:acyl-CoA dehydrogenase [Bacteroidales bacterium]
ENKLGIKGSPTCELVFKNAEVKLVGDRRMGLIKYVMALMNGARLGVGGQSVGLSEAAYREGLKYAKERVQFGKAIIEFPAVYEMLTKMKAKLQASRSLLYETGRFVDIYKALEAIMHERKLTPEERKEMKTYKKKSDFYTPLLKFMSSEYSNEIAYDSLQIHAGTGFMKDFPIERIYRDARITTIYEGTSQLQVVAAIRGVTTGFYATQMEAYAEQINEPELDYLKRILVEMTEEYKNTVAKVTEINDNEYTDFHARRMVEMAGNIIMGYLLLNDTIRSDEYKNSAEVYIKLGNAQNKERASYIENSELKDLGLFKMT